MKVQGFGGCEEELKTMGELVVAVCSKVWKSAGFWSVVELRKRIYSAVVVKISSG